MASSEALTASHPAPGCELGVGCAPLGNLYTPVSDDDALETVQAALSLGMTFFDTAPHYGAGLSEKRLGEALTGVRRSSYRVATKVGRRVTDGNGVDVPPGECGRETVFDLSRDGVLRSLEGSLLRLGLDRVDVLYLHDPPSVDEAIPGAFRALQALRDEGVVGQIGVGMNFWEPLAQFVRDTDPDLVMVAGRLTLLDASALHGLLPVAGSRGVEVVAAGVFNSGVLAKPETGAKYDYLPASTSVLDRARALAAACAEHGVELRTAAMQYPRLFDEVSRVVVGVRTKAEVVAAREGWECSVPTALWSSLADLGVPLTCP